MSEHKPEPLTKLALLKYALDGAQTQLGVGLGGITDEEEHQLRTDIAKIEGKITRLLLKLEESP